MSNNSEISQNGLWTNNVALVQLLGLCPLLAVSSTIVNGIGLGLATLITLLISNTLVSMIRGFVRPEVRLPVFVLIIASIVTMVELAMQALFYDLYLVLGIFIPLIVTNCLIIGRAEAFASRQNISTASIDALAMGIGFSWVLICLGALREVIGQGTLFSDANLLFGDLAVDWTLNVLSADHTVLIALLPPGAFLVLGLLLALKNFIDQSILKN